MSGKKVYLSEYAERLTQARWDRRKGYRVEDPDRPAYLTDEAYRFALKIAAYWEGGPDPESDEATGELEDVPMPETYRLPEGDDRDL